MSIHFDQNHIVSGDFGCLEPADPAWLDQEDYWEDFNSRFFKSNGRGYDLEQDSNVKTWLTAPDRAPFSAMADRLIDELSARIDLSDVDLVLLAHWMPDLHLGTSVTNFAQHKLGIENGLGFAVSDRGPSAALFIIDMAARYLKGDRRKALIMVMDQKHLLYRSPMVERLRPRNSGAIMLLEAGGPGSLQYAGYTRTPEIKFENVAAQIANICKDAGLKRSDVTVIVSPDLAQELYVDGPVKAYEMARLCAGPFAALAEMQDVGGSVMLVTYNDGELATVLMQACTQKEGIA